MFIMDYGGVLMFLLLFSLLLIWANIYFFIKKKYLYLFTPCMLFLPDYYGIEISYSLPIITVTRMMFLVFYIYVFLNKKRSITVEKIKNSINDKRFSKELYFLFLYFVFRIISNCYYIPTYGQASKTILLIVFEQFLLVVAFYMLAPTKQELVILFKSIIWTAAVLFVLGIVESFTHYKLFDGLYTVSRPMLNDVYIRLGFLRSVTTMGLPNFYGNMCVLVTPFIIYLLRITNEKKYTLILFLNVLAIIHSGCRSDILFFFFIILICVLFIYRTKEERISFAKSISIVLIMLFIWIITLSSVNESCRYYYSGTGKSILNLAGFDFDLNANAPDGTNGYGDNSDAVYSRTFQLSAIDYTLSVTPLFGLGSGCENRGDIQYLYNGKWRQGNGFDLGIVEIICSEGLIGLLGYLSLFLFFVIAIINLKSSKTICTHMQLDLALLLVLSYILCIFSTSNMPHFLTLITVILFLMRVNHA